MAGEPETCSVETLNLISKKKRALRTSQGPFSVLNMDNNGKME